MHIVPRIIFASVFILLSGFCIYGWLVQSEWPASFLGQSFFGVSYIICIGGAIVFGLWRRKPVRGFPVIVQTPKKGK